jgi:Putative Actinobacterial Holin-X, holin superfamily III
VSEQLRARQHRAQDGAAAEPTVREMGALLLTQFATLLGREIALARAELVAHARQFSLGGLALLTGALLGLSGWFVLLAAAVAGLAQALPVWLAAVIVGAALCLLAGGAILWAARRLAGAGQPLPMTTESIRQDLQAIRDGAHR